MGETIGVVTTAQAAAMLNVTSKRILQLIKAEKLAAWMETRGPFDGRMKWVIRAQDVMDYDLARRSWAPRLRQWRQTWAVNQNQKRRERERRERIKRRIDDNNRRVEENVVSRYGAYRG